ncbi:MAG TPA: phage tail protein [Bryobacteraceae bacterium]|nr:phage tail protein [Bryobacteraceae bacterium]
MIPARNNYWLLDSVAGWQIATSADGSPLFTGLTYTQPDGDITLDPLPGSAVFLDSTLAGGIRCPVALAGDKQGRVFVLDRSNCRVTVLDLTASRAHLITAFGGCGSKLRHFQSPQSLTVLPSGAIAIADTGNGRVQLFSASPYALLQVWSGAGKRTKPWALASDHCGIVYILDRVSRSILRVRADGEWLDPIGAGTLTDPIELAVGADQTVAVVDGRGVSAGIVIFPNDGSKPVRLTLVSAPLSLAFDASGNLFAGTGNSVVSKLEPDATQPVGWSLAGDGVSDVDGSIAKVAWIAGHGIYAILKSAAAASTPRLFSMNPQGAYRLLGQFVTGPLDSNIETCSWHRVQVRGTVPAGTSLLIESSTSEQLTNDNPNFDTCVLAGADNPDCLVQSAPGRYLQLRFTLRSSGAASPEIHALKVFFPRQSYLQYLPAVFQDDDESRLFLDRFLSIFQTAFDNFDQYIDTLWQLFDPFLVPDQYFQWLAAWVALPLDPDLTPATKRQLLKSAFETYRIRGTVAGLQQVIQAYTGVENIRILEHFRLRNWTSFPAETALPGARLWSSNFYARLQVGVTSQVGSFRLTDSPQPASEPLDWGANRFSLLFPANPYSVQDTETKIQKIVDREKPAYTQAFLCPIFPRLRVGIQATLGIDAYVGKTNSMILGKLATLRYDSILSASPLERDTQALGLSLHPRLGVDARIL